MPSDQEQWDATVAQIAVDVYLYKKGTVVVETDLQGNNVDLLQDPPAHMIPAVLSALQDLTQKFFQNNSGLQNPDRDKIINPDLLVRWLTECKEAPGVDPGNPGTSAGIFRAFVAGEVSRSAASKAMTLNEMLVAGGKQIEQYHCATLDQAATVRDVASRLNLNYKNNDDRWDTDWFKTIADVASNNPSTKGSLYDAAVRLNNVWLEGWANLEQVLDNPADLPAVEDQIKKNNTAAASLTDIAEYGHTLRAGKEPSVRGNPLLIKPPAMSQDMERMVKSVGAQFFGLPGGTTKDGRVVDPAVIQEWALDAPKQEMASAQTPEDRGKKLISYVTRAMQSIDKSNAAATPDKLANAYREKVNRKCQTIEQAAQVIDYADAQVLRGASMDREFRDLYRDRDKALETMDSIQKKSGFTGSEFEFITQVQRVDAVEKGELLLRDKETLKGGMDREVGPGPDRELERE